jgi:uncharacterized FAD-dependent dehydrogenase
VGAGGAGAVATLLLAAAEIAGVEVEFLFQRQPVIARLQQVEQQLLRQSEQLRGLQERLGRS